MMMRLPMKITPWRVLALVILVLGAIAGFRRFYYGLGAATNLTDEFPWGIWVSFDILCGVGLAAGGFTISAMVYVFHLDKYRPIVRPAVLTAFIGYLLVVGGLAFDLGQPWRIWHPIVMWNPHSVMFEIGWCVTLYTTVLALEVSAMVFERLRWARAARIAHRVTFPLVILAVLLSMLHQSSLGSLFLIVPGRLHELWYSPVLPLLFFVSAIGIGLAMTIVESTLSARAFGRYIEADILRGVARLAAVIMGIYLAIRFTDLIVRGAIVHVWPLDRASIFFLIEILVGFVAPMVLFAQSRIRRNPRWLYHAAQMAVLGFIVNRLNVGITGFEVIKGYTYVPSWEEISITLMLITVGTIAFTLAARHLPVFHDETSVERAREVFAKREHVAGSGGGISSAAAPWPGRDDRSFFPGDST